MITVLSQNPPHLYVSSQIGSNILIRVVAIATSDEEANRFMLENPNTGVVQIMGELVLIADTRDQGTSL